MHYNDIVSVPYPERDLVFGSRRFYRQI